ncbi:MAG: ABC transporter ATP-binding protein [Erythrobacter sp.]
MHLTATDLGKTYDGRLVLAGVSFSLAPGERALLLGPSGSGKSTLLNLLCGLQRPDSGRVTLDDAAIDDGVRRRHFGIVFQSLRLVSALSLGANLALAQKLQTGSGDPARVDALLERLGIADRAHARPHELSQGEAQRAAIARALVVRPAILIADEPTSALDAANAAAVAGLLRDLAEETGAALLVATHDDRLRPHFARTLKLNGGRLVA